MPTGLKLKRRGEKKRIQLGVIISREMKRRIEVLARKSGRSQGQVAEQLMLEAFAYHDLVAAMRKGFEEIHKGNVEAELYRMGYTLIRETDAAGKIFKAWAEPGFPQPLKLGSLTSQRGGFIPPDEGDPRSIELRQYPDGSEEIITKSGEEEPK